MTHKYDNSSGYYEYIPCSKGHRWVWTSRSSTGQPYEGTPCECGKTIYHSEECPTCHQPVSKAVQVKEE